MTAQPNIIEKIHVSYYQLPAAEKKVADYVLLHRDQIQFMSITRFSKSPAAKIADVVLCCGSNEGPYQFGFVPAKIAQLVTVDFLFQEYFHRNQESCEKIAFRLVLHWQKCTFNKPHSHSCRFRRCGCGFLPVASRLPCAIIKVELYI